MSNVITSRSYMDFPVVTSNGVTAANSWVLIQDNLPNANGGIGNTYRITSKALVAAAGNVQIAVSNSSPSNSTPSVSRRWIDFPVVSSNISLSNTWILAQDNLPNSNGGTGHTFRLTIPTAVQSSANAAPFQLFVANSAVNLPSANQYPDTIALVANTTTGALSIYSSNGSSWSTAQGGTGDAFFRFIQSQANTVWSIDHGLNKYPSVTVVDTAGTQGFGTVSYIDSNNVTVSFSAAFAGTAYLN